MDKESAMNSSGSVGLSAFSAFSAFSARGVIDREAMGVSVAW